MKHLLYIIVLFGLLSCEKVEDHYRIIGITIKVGRVTQGPNAQCLNFGQETDSTYEDFLGIQIEFIREYYSTDSSRTSGPMYSPKGWKGCNEKISKLNLTSGSLNLRNLLFGDTTITGVDKNNLSYIRCQENFGCDCRSALSIQNIDSLISLFNNQHITQNRIFISEGYDQTPFVFFIKKEDVKSLNEEKIKIQLEMSDGQIVAGVSNKIILKESN